MSQNSPSLWLVAVLLLSGVALSQVPAPLTTPVRAVLLDALRPARSGLVVVEDSLRTVREQWRSADDTAQAAELSRLRKTLEDQQDVQRQQLALWATQNPLAASVMQASGSSVIAAHAPTTDRDPDDLGDIDANSASRAGSPIKLAHAAEESPRHSVLPPGPALQPGDAGVRLLVPQLLTAAVLGEQHGAAWRSGVLLNEGQHKGVREAALVLKSKAALVDVGLDQRLSIADPVLMGQAVLGKIDQVGRWTSTFRRVTDPDFRARAQLLRMSEQGPVFGARGLFKGTGGDHCSLQGIAINEPARVGDWVVFADRDGILPAPLFLGRVQQVEGEEGDRDWQINVEPIPVPTTLTTVQVLRMVLNPSRDFSPASPAASSSESGAPRRGEQPADDRPAGQPAAVRKGVSR